MRPCLLYTEDPPVPPWFEFTYLALSQTGLESTDCEFQQSPYQSAMRRMAVSMRHARVSGLHALCTGWRPPCAMHGFAESIHRVTDD